MRTKQERPPASKINNIIDEFARIIEA